MTQSLLFALAIGGATLIGAAQNAPHSACHVDGKAVLVRDLPEGSGIAASRRRPGVLWAHNDSSMPDLIALDERGAVVGRVRVSGARVDDWEDVAVGPCPGGSCIYIGDIGDNNGTRAQVTVYRVPEPAAGATTTAPAEAFQARYPDGPHDAESLFVTAAGEIFLVTKGNPGPIALYRFPRAAAGKVVQLERIGAPMNAGKSDGKDRPTGAGLSQDGKWVAVRSSDHVSFFPADAFTAGQWTESFRADLRGLDEPQGEGVTFGKDGTIFLLGEGTARGGTFARLECTLAKPPPKGGSHEKY